jgi:hypothetical protein
MKKLLLPFCGLLATAAISQAQTATIGQWSFEAGQPSALASTLSVTGTSYGSIPSDIGTGSASGTHASSSTFSSPSGNGSARAFSANTWAQGDYWQFSLNLDPANNTYAGLGVAFDQNGSSTGPKTFYFAYSTDGSSFTKMGDDYALTSGITWSATIAGQPTHESFDLSSIAALNTANILYFRIVEDSPVTGGAVGGGNVASGGTDRVDNFTITAQVTPVPEPGTCALFGLALTALWAARRRN